MFGCNESTRSPSPSGQDTSKTKDAELLLSPRKRGSSEALNKSVGESPSKRRLVSFRDSSDSEDSGPNKQDSDEEEDLHFESNICLCNISTHYNVGGVQILIGSTMTLQFGYVNMEVIDFSKLYFDEENLVVAEASSSDKNYKFSIGSFIVLKQDFHTRNSYPVWRIEERSLQRFIPIIKDGKQLFKNTNQYREWGIIQKDQYYSVPVTSLSQYQTEIIVELELG